jgi:AcrR family transcriptional regulator
MCAWCVPVSRGAEGTPNVSATNSSEQTGQPRRRRKRLLSEESILDAALSLVDETGELTMAALAARVGSTASSIYHHFRGRQAIIEALRERVGAGIAVPAETDDWEPALLRFLRDYRDAFARHPRIIPLLTAQTISGDSTVVVYDRLLRILDRAGLPLGEHLLWVSVLDNFVLGSALDAAAPDEVWSASHLDTPALNAAVAAAPTGRERADAAFLLGAEALVTGMRARLQAEPRRVRKQLH